MTIENGFLYKALTKGVVNIFDSAFLFLSFRIFQKKFLQVLILKKSFKSRENTGA